MVKHELFKLFMKNELEQSEKKSKNNKNNKDPYINRRFFCVFPCQTVWSRVQNVMHSHGMLPSPGYLEASGNGMACRHVIVR